jgi:MFS superfamily sulfate permease-like transporter
LNLGNFIRFISHPVMSGFTTGAAMTIGLNQISPAFGFGSSVVPSGAQHV